MQLFGPLKTKEEQKQSFFPEAQENTTICNEVETQSIALLFSNVCVSWPELNWTPHCLLK